MILVIDVSMHERTKIIVYSGKKEKEKENRINEAKWERDREED